jgi:DNA-binding FrmR family transcriptional regulator
MSHTVKHKTKLLNRVRRIRGQVEALERAIEAERSGDEVLHQIAAARGAMNGLMVEVLEGHIREHVANPEIADAGAREVAVDELIDVIRAYLK